MFEVKRLDEIDLEIESRLVKMLDAAFEGDFSAEDWEHTFGGYRFLGFLEAELIAHGAIVPRKIYVDSQHLTVGYVEGVAVDPRYWRNGYGSSLMAAITKVCRENFEVSMLSTDEKAFYTKHGWRDFQGESFVLVQGTEVRSEEEDEGLMYLLGNSTSDKGPRKVVCESRDGDSW